VVLIGCFILLYSGGEASLGNWIFTYATALAGDGFAGGALLNSTYWGMLTIGRLAFIPITTRLRSSVYTDDGVLSGSLMSALTLIVAGGSRLASWLGWWGSGSLLPRSFRRRSPC
jgi:fucose permease